MGRRNSVAADGTRARRILAQADEGGRGGAFAGLAWLPGTPYIAYQFVPWPHRYADSEYGVISAEVGPAKMLFTNGLGLNLSPHGRLIHFMRIGQKQPGAEEGGDWVAVLQYGGVPTSTPAASGAPAPGAVVRGLLGGYAAQQAAAPFGYPRRALRALIMQPSPLTAPSPIGTISTTCGVFSACSSHLDGYRDETRSECAERV